MPAALFDRLAARCPVVPPGFAAGAAFGLFLAASGLVAFHLPVTAAPLLLAALVADGLGQALARRRNGLVRAATPVGLLLLPFGFALDEPSRALAAMFLMLGLSVFTSRRGITGLEGIPWLHGVAGAALLGACLLPNNFSIAAYSIGIACFVLIGQGMVRKQELP